MRSQALLLSSTCLLASFLSGGVSVTVEPRHNAKTGQVKGYYPSYNTALKGQYPSQINYSLYTDLIFFAVEPAADHQLKYDKKLTTAEGDKLASEFVALAKKNNVNPQVSFGGWLGSRYFSDFTANKEERKKFARSIVKFTKERGFVGIEIDWEYPNSSGVGCNSHNTNDTINFGLLLKEIRALWPDVTISAAIGITGLVGADGAPATPLETANLVKHLNYVNIMAYDVFGPWSTKTGPIAPLHGTCAPAASSQSVETGLQVAFRQGFKPEQIVMGIPGYAKRFELVSPTLKPTKVNGITSYYYQNHTKVTPPGGKFDDRPQVDICGIDQAWGGSFLTRELSTYAWLSPDQKTGINGYKRYFDKCSGQPFITNGRYFISYDDTESTVKKAEFVKAHNLAGIFFFDTQGPLDATVKAAGQALRG